MYTKDEIKGIFMCLGKPFTAIYGGEGKTIIRTQVLLRGRTEFLTPLSETLEQYKVESNIQHQSTGAVLAITSRDSLLNLLNLWDEIPEVLPKGNEHHWKLLKDFLDGVSEDKHKTSDGLESLKWMIRDAKQ
tara:strand:- start:386 stop:781 length:396 start_codon:yes stop_codon:yes gene_type:complete